MSGAPSPIMRYVVGRDELRRIFWRRTIVKPARLVRMGLLVLAGVLLIAIDGSALGTIVGLACLLTAVLTPFVLYRYLGRAIDANPQFTDPKSLEFDDARLLVTGPDWKSEIPWTRYTGLDEDAHYFYLELGRTGIASVVPKHAFAPGEEARFRASAQAIGTARAAMPAR